jgi:hypothetical protein
MSTIQAASLLVGTTISATGGTATSLISKGDTLEQHNTALDDGSSLAEQTEINFTIKQPKVNASSPAGYTQARNVVVISSPKTLANLAVTKNSCRIEFSFDRETTDAEKATMRELAAQAIIDTDFVSFWNSQSVS